MTIQELKDQNLLLFECISGSKAYGLATPQSDTDIKGIFVMPRNMFYGLDQVHQVNDANNDEVYYELGKFMDLLSKNNPNLMEMLYTPEDCVLYKHPLFDRIQPVLFLSKLAKDSFAGYAAAQIKKARGLNKKIMNPMDERRKSVLDFCFVPKGQGAAPVAEFLLEQGLRQEDMGLANVPHMPGLYSLFAGPAGKYKGIVQNLDSNDVSLSSIPKTEQPLTVMSFNKMGYSKYCKDYKAYWNWVKNRNEARFQNTMDHGKNYDSKNMMHTLRLLDMALEIASIGSIQVRRPDREFLLKVKKGEFQYDYLVELANAKLKRVEAEFANSDLQEAPDIAYINDLLVDIRKAFYDQ